MSVPTPELDKQRACNEPQPPFDVLTRFWDWLEAEGFVIARYGVVKERSVQCQRCRGRGFDPEGLTAREQQLLARGALPDADRSPCRTCEGSGVVWRTHADEDSLAPAMLTPTALFARFWGLDLDKIDQERQALLDELRNEATA